MNLALKKENQNLGRRLVSPLYDIPLIPHQQILPACSHPHYTHPWACVFSLVSHQDVKHISFFQRKDGRNKDPMVAFVVVFGSFSSCSPISRDPEGGSLQQKEI